MSPAVVELVGTVVGIVVVIPVFGVLWWLLMRKIDRDGVEAGGSSGRQFLGGRERTYAATITIPGLPPEHLTVRYHSRGEAKRALRSMYGKRHVSDVRVVVPERSQSSSA